MYNKINRLKLKRFDRTLQIYNTPPITEVEQLFAALLIFLSFLSLLITLISAQTRSSSTTPLPLHITTTTSDPAIV
jgi:hypothetical protein